MSQDIFGKEVLPTLEVDAHGLLLDCTFVGMPGQISFFEDQGNLDGFNGKMSAALDLATSWGYASSRFGFDPPRFDYASIARLGGVKFEKPTKGKGRFDNAEAFENFGNEELDENTIVSFTINFDVNDTNFSADQFGAEFTRAMQAASTFGNAVVMIRGHADPTKALGEFVRAGLEKKTIRVTGQKGNYRYFLRTGAKVDLTQTETIEKLIQTGEFETRTHQPMRVMQAALNLSQARAEAVKASVIDFARKQGVTMDTTQIKPVGAGISDPVVPRPVSKQQAAENRRVEFRIIRVPAEALNANDFDF
jgi:outer membrane protein OmpA-like peptidoglycan-associated protein